MKTSQCLLAEAIGAFLFCFAGIAAILSTQDPINSGAGIVGIALAHGLALSVAVNAFGGVSGAHFNPAVTVGMLVTGRIKFDRAVQYILAQLVGGTVAAWACHSFFPAAAVTSAKLGIPLPGAGNMPGTEGAWLTLPILLGVEFVLTFLLMTAIFGTAVDERGQAVKIGGFGIGLTVTFDILAGGAITGASEVLYIANYGHDHYQRQWEAELGLPWEGDNRENWERISPFNRVEHIETPTLIMGGEDDWNVPILNSEQLYQALRRRGVETQLVVYPGQSHGIRLPSYQVDRYERYLGWYDKYVRGARRPISE